MIRSERNKNLVEYFRKNLAKGYTEESLKWALLNQGYLRVEVLKAIEQVHKELAEKAPVLKEKPKIKYQIIDEYDNPIIIEPTLWERIKNLFV